MCGIRDLEQGAIGVRRRAVSGQHHSGAEFPFDSTSLTDGLLGIGISYRRLNQWDLVVENFNIAFTRKLVYVQLGFGVYRAPMS